MTQKITPKIKQNRAKWIRALRGGRYRQVEGRLRTVHQGKVMFCCLGVACQISKLGKWKENDFDYYHTNSDSSHTSLNGLPSVRRWLGMTPRQNDQAIHMNDQISLSFKRIAEHFEEIWRME